MKTPRHTKEATRAARVLLQAADAQDCLDPVTADIRALRDAIDSLQRDTARPWPDLIRSRIINGTLSRLAPLLAQTAATPLMQRFILLLPKFKLLRQLPQVCDAYLLALDAHRNITPVTITTPHPLPDPLRDQLLSTLSLRLHTTLRPLYATDPALIAGFTYATPDRSGDFSLLGALHQLRRQLTTTPIQQPKATP